ASSQYRWAVTGCRAPGADDRPRRPAGRRGARRHSLQRGSTMLRIALAFVHLLALGIGLGAVWVRARALRGTPDHAAIQQAMAADGWWGAAAALWIGSGLWRLLDGTEKATEFYLANHVFLAKMGGLLLILVLEIFPIVTLVRWRVASRR